MVPEDESVTIMAGDMVAVRCGSGAVAGNSHLIYKRKRDWAGAGFKTSKPTTQ